MLISTHPEGVGTAFSNWMWSKREMKGMSRSELARRCDISTEMIHKIESGDRVPSLETAKKLLDALNVSYTRDEERPRVFRLQNGDTILIMTLRAGRGKTFHNRPVMKPVRRIPEKSRKHSCF